MKIKRLITTFSLASVVIFCSEAHADISDTGFTIIKASPDTKKIYVSSSEGDNKNDCSSPQKPCKTIGAGLEKMRKGYPDHLYLKRGDVWRDQRFINLHSGRSAQEPAVISYYGDHKERPKLENAAAALHIFKGKMTNFHFIGLEFSAYKMDPNNPEFTGANGADITLLGGNENILFEDNKFTYTEVILQLWNGENPKNISLRRNIWTGAYYNQSSFNRNKRPSNLYADGVDGLLMEENVFDHGGWHQTVAGAGANMFNHNIYVQHSTVGQNLILRNNIITRASSHGAQLRSGGLAENNFFARNAIGLLIGYSDKPLVSGVRAHAVNNVVSEGHSMVKGDKPCSGNVLCTPALWGIDFNINGDADYQAHGNIVFGQSPEDTNWNKTYKSLVRKAFLGLDSGSIKASNNILWKWDTPNQGAEKKYSAPGRTLGGYNQILGGQNSFDEFMTAVLNRQVGTWDAKYSAAAINQFIRDGFK